MKVARMAVMLMLLIGLSVSTYADEQKLSVAGTEVTVNNGHRKIVGVANNTTGEMIGMAVIMFNLYDESGAKVGDTMAVGHNIEPNVPWRFSAALFEPAATRYRLVDISAY